MMIYILILCASAAFVASAYSSLKLTRLQIKQRLLELPEPKPLVTSKFFCMLRANEGFVDTADRSKLETAGPVRLTEFRHIEIDEDGKTILIGAPLVLNPSADEQEKYEILSTNQKRVLAAKSMVRSVEDSIGSPASIELIIIDRTSSRMIRTRTDAWFNDAFFPKGHLGAHAEFFECDQQAAVRLQK